MAKLHITIPNDLKKDLHIKCIGKDISMTDKIIELIKKDLDEDV
jgi:hypothetical protein